MGGLSNIAHAIDYICDVNGIYPVYSTLRCICLRGTHSGPVGGTRTGWFHLCLCQLRMVCRALLGGSWGSPALSEGPGQGWAIVGSEEDVGARSLLPPSGPGTGKRATVRASGQRASEPPPEQGSWLAWVQEASLVPPSAQDTPRAHPAASENLPGAMGTIGAPHT